MDFIRFIIRRKVLVSMLFIGVVLLGVVSYRQLPMELYPDAELPLLIVQVRTSQDLDPNFVEKQAILPVEGAVSSLQGVDRIETSVQRNGGMIYVYFNKGVNVKFAYIRLDERLNAVRNNLDERFQVSVVKVDTEQLSNQFMTLQVLGEGGLERVRELTDQKVVPELESIDGIANVQVYGGRERALEIVLDQAACRAYGITPSQISSLISQNAASKSFVGIAYDRDRRIFVNLVADYTAVDQLQNIIVRSDGPVRLRDVADVYFGVKEPTSISRIDGRDAVNIQLMRDSQVNLIDLARRTRAVIGELNERLAPFGLKINIQSDSAEQIEKNIDLIIQLAAVGGLLAAAVLWLFLRNLRWVLVIALAIPVSIFAAFNFFYIADISLNSLTLVGMALAVGMLLDNSVVVMENIYRLLPRSRSVENAVVQGSAEVWRSILASTLTTITVFLPFAFAQNYLIRLMGRHIGVSIVATLLVSLSAALLLVPMVTHALLEKRPAGDVLSFRTVSMKNRLLQIYTVIFKECMRRPARTIIGAVLFFFITVLLALALSVNVPQEVELREFNIYVTMPRGSSLENTDRLTAQIEEQLADLKEKEQIVSTINEEDAVVTVRLVEDFEKKHRRSLQQIKDDVMNRVGKIPGGEISLQQPSGGGRFRGSRGGSFNLERLLGIGQAAERIVVKGSDFAAMTRLAEEINGYLEQLDFIQRSGVSVSPERPEVHLIFDRMRMEDYGVTPQQIASELGTFRSEFTSSLTFKQGAEEYEITIRGDSLVEKSLIDLQQLQIPSSNGGTVALSDVSRIVLSQGMASIERVNQEKQVEVNYSFLSEVTASKELLEASRAQIDELIASINIPSGMAVEVVHDENDLSDFTFLIGVSFILIYMILASVFESMTLPVVMMFTIPLAAIGALWALILTGNSVLNANTLIGFLILLGVVVNNGIIFIDYSQILRRRGYSRSRALLTAGQARVRPILITAITTIMAMVPLAMGKAEYVERIGAPFAITVIGGLSLSTLFTLVFIPTFYTGLENALAWIRRQRLEAKVIEAVTWAGLTVLIYLYVDSLLWRLFYLFAVTVLTPATAYFLSRSLRRASDDVPNQELVITIRRLVKIYDRGSRFVREWQKGKQIRRHAGLDRPPQSWSDLSELVWQVPLFLFLVYFTYFYLNTYFRCLVFSLIVFLVVVNARRRLEPFLCRTYSRAEKTIRIAGKALFWGLPLLNLVFYFVRWRAIASAVLIGVLWYFALAVYVTSDRLHREQVNIARVSGRFAKLRRIFYRLVQKVPIIGKRRRPFRALDGVSLTIGSGMFGLLGPNGAGKTTLMRIICGILEQSMGKVEINGKDLQVDREELQGLIGYLPQEFGMYENMTAYEYLDYQALLKGLIDAELRRERIEQVLQAVHLLERKDDKIGAFSGGMKQRVGIAQTLLHLPRILVVDEPTAGLDPRERIRFRNLLVELSRDRIVIFSTHIIEDISSSCNEVAVLHKGKLKFWGTPTEMAQLAQGRVWQFSVDPAEFDTLVKRLTVVHHMRADGAVRVRCIADEPPAADAVPVTPTLEDSYLYLLKKQ